MTEHVPRLRFSLDLLIGEAKRRMRRRRVLIALCILLLAGFAAGLTLAFGSRGTGPGGGHLDAFKGIGAAQRAQTGANVLPPRVLAAIKEGNAEEKRLVARAAKAGRHISYGGAELPETARVLGTTPDATTFYGLSDTLGHLCIVTYGGPFDFSAGCVAPFSRSRPITMDTSGSAALPATSRDLQVTGVAMDGVTSVSFSFLSWNRKARSSMCAWSTSPVCRARRSEITVPVMNNVYSWTRQHAISSSVRCAVAHFADGSAVNLPDFPPCASGRASGDTSERTSR